MAQELVLVATAVISSLSALAGVGLTWALGNISAESKDRRLEREAARHRLEDKYVQVLGDIDLYLRAGAATRELNEKLAVLGATVSVFAGKRVLNQFNELSKALDKYMDAIGDTSQKALADFHKDYPEEWRKVMEVRNDLIDEVRAETMGLQNF